MAAGIVKAALAAMLLSVSGSAAAEDPNVEQYDPATGNPIGEARAWGVSFDVGVPDFTAVSLHYRPLRYLRVNGGMLYNTAALGLRAGASVQPYWPVAPSFSVEAGHYFEADARKRVSSFADVDSSVEPLLEKVGYSFVSAHVGIEAGWKNRFVFFLKTGLSRVWLNVNNAEAAARSATQGDETRVTALADPSIRLGIPNAKLGFLYYF